jgi:glycosyltransferase involved in cell wall biosynthesis
LGIQQRVLPAYRAAFFDLLAVECQNGLSVFAGLPRTEESLGAMGDLQVAQLAMAKNVHLGRGRLYACVQQNLTRWLEEWNPDVLVVEANPRYLKTPAALSWMKSHHKPVIGWGLGAPPVRGFWRKMLRERFLSSFDALLTYSQTGAAQYRGAGFPAERIFVAHNAVSQRPKNSMPERSTEFENGKGRVLFVGRLQQRKRIDLLLRSCAALPAALQPQLTLVGDGPARRDLQALAADVYPQAVFTGEINGAALEPYYTAADLFVLPGTGGLAVQQAMGWGLPVIVAEADGTQADLVRPGNGWLLPPGDGAALTQRIQAALSNPGKLRGMGAESFRIVVEEINLESMVQAFKTAVETVLKTVSR